MHTQQRMWVEKLKKLFPDWFINKSVVEVGSANINGSTREYFDGCSYIGVDVAPGTGVDMVSIFHEAPISSSSVDVVFSTSQLEHDMYWQKTLLKMVDVLKPQGKMFFSCGSMWPEHGTNAHMPGNSLTTGLGNDWGSYYHNVNALEVASVLDLNDLFMEWQMGLDSGMDLYFWGIKR